MNAQKRQRAARLRARRTARQFAQPKWEPIAMEAGLLPDFLAYRQIILWGTR